MKKRDDLDLNEFETILKERLQQIEDNIAQLRSELDSVGSDDGMNDLEDLASLQTLSSKDNRLLEQQENERKETIHALAKIKNGTYGICEKSHKPIPLERLKVNPIARTRVNIEED
jgi:DnaK suppressor protein